MNGMEKYGLDSKNINISNNQTIGRIISRNHNTYKAITESGEINAEISDSFKYKLGTMSDYPVVGDFVIIETQKGFNYISKIINRKNQLVRKGEWYANSDYLIAANIDTIFILMSLDSHIEKLKAYISISSNINVEIIVILNKYESIPEKILDEVKDITKGMNVIISSDISKEKAKIKSFMHEGKTTVFLGPEHDKAKMVNKLFDNINLENQLTLLSGGCILINTPEMRELGIESFHITEKFADIR
ncbi:GTPase RsgA [Sedimentibacter sp.]|uniref:GTPase RsgA n=1 Tax=Sedimentibacter sp. TaxID=1960295 RepID=UPI0028A6C264|nr:GTPase RsgA [Sedimentibacter sp.]